MLKLIAHILKEKRKELRLPIILMSLDSVGGMLLYIMLYFTVVGLVRNTLTGEIIITYSLICLGAVVFRLIIYRTGYYLCFARGAEVCAQMRLDLANHYRALSLGYFNRHSSGALLETLVKDITNFELIITHTLPALVKTAVTAALILIGMYCIDVPLAIAQTITLLVLVPFLHWGSSLAEYFGNEKHRLTARMISIVLEYIKGIKVFKAYNLTGEKFDRMLYSLETVRKTNIKAEIKLSLPAAVYFIAAHFLLPLALLSSVYILKSGSVSPEKLTAFMLMSLALSGVLISFEHAYGLLKGLKPAAEHVQKAYTAQPLPCLQTAGTAKVNTGTTVGETRQEQSQPFDVSFDDVSFSYREPFHTFQNQSGESNTERETDGAKQTAVLHSISFEAKQGTVTALIGPSGSGKTTIANLIARFWDPQKGTVKIGGKDIKEIEPDTLLQSVSAAFQDSILLSDTIYNNIKIGKPDASESEVIAAAQAAQCHKFISEQPDGYNTLLAEGGAALSGGERQRIAIARALLKNAPIVLLDESTASLDADNEWKINAALDTLMQGKTVFVIAHRLNTIRNADQIIVLKNGRIEEKGTHTELMQKRGTYFEMIQEQQKAAGWEVSGELIPN